VGLGVDQKQVADIPLLFSKCEPERIRLLPTFSDSIGPFLDGTRRLECAKRIQARDTHEATALPALSGAFQIQQSRVEDRTEPGEWSSDDGARMRFQVEGRLEKGLLCEFLGLDTEGGLR
jgi:hypothetical protein